MDKKSIMKRIDALEAALPGKHKISLVIVRPCKADEADQTGKGYKAIETRMKRGLKGVYGVTYNTVYMDKPTDYKRTEANTGPVITLVRGLKPCVKS